MPRPNAFPLVAVDIGNSRMKLGCFEREPSSPRTEPERTIAVSLDANLESALDSLPRAAREFRWAISSVNRPPTARLIEALAARGVSAPKLLAHTDLPLVVDLAEPGRVGMDRLANALAARELRHNQGPAIVISVGSAITVDLLTAQGTFAGGAIMPSLDMSARALQEFTDLLPLVAVDESAPVLGRSTVEAIQSGLYWGAIGAINELIRRLDPSDTAEVFMTGGGAPPLVAKLCLPSGKAPALVPHLTLAGIALAMRDRPPALP